MIGGIGNVLLSTYSQTENGEDPLVFFGEPLNHVITIRGQILVSRTNDDPCVFTKRPPCVNAKRPRVYRHHAHMLKHMCAWCRHTRGRFECTHGGHFVHTHTVFSTFFQRAATHTNTHTHTRTKHSTQHHSTQHHTETETERDRERETEKTRQRKRRQDKRREDETRKEKTRQEKRRNEKMKEERREKTCEDEGGEKRKDM